MTRANRRPLPHQQGGFSLIDVLLALGVVILISGITLTGIRRTNESNQAKAVGEQMKMVGSALNTYVSLRYDTLVAHVPGTDDVPDDCSTCDATQKANWAADPGPRTCVWTNSPTNTAKMCTITSETLRRNGLLPNSFSGYNAFGSTYEYRIRIDTAGASPMVDGMVWTDEAYTMEGEERFDLLGQAMMVAGADSGMTRSTLTRVEGFNGAWSEENMGVSKLGVLAYRVGYNTFGYAAYLRLNGTGDGSMLGDIDMGNHQIFGLSALKAEHLAVKNAHFKQDEDAIVFSAPGSFDTTDATAIGARAATDPSIMADTSTGTARLVLKSDAPVAVRTADGSTDGDMTVGDITASGAISTNTLTASDPGNSIVAQGSIVSGARIRAQSGFLAGSTTAAQNKTLMFSGSGAAGDAGGIYFNVDGSGVASTPMGLKLDSSTATLRVVNSNILADGNIRAAGDLLADDRVVVGGNEVIIDSTINPAIGDACTLATYAGTLARSSSGDLVQCFSDGTSSRWRTMGTNIVQQAGAQTCTGAGAAMGNSVTISCPAGYSIVSGGYSWVSGSPRGTAAVNTRSGNTAWVVQAGPTAAYLGTETVASCFSTYAICSR